MKRASSTATARNGACDAVTLVCDSSQCTDEQQDGNETGVDCGGACAGCPIGEGCAVDGDCQSGACDATGLVCVADQCADHRTDGAETDVDCGGGTCAACALNQACSVASDCASGNCGTAGGVKKCLPTYTLTITKPSHGTISGTGGLDCGSGGNVCSVTLPSGIGVSLTETPDNGYALSTWGNTGICSDAGPPSSCAFNMLADEAMAPAFSPLTYGVEIYMGGDGTISDNVGVLDACGTTECTGYYARGSTVTLTITARSGHTFVDWGDYGPCVTSTNPVCTFTVTQDWTNANQWSPHFD